MLHRFAYRWNWKRIRVVKVACCPGAQRFLTQGSDSESWRNVVFGMSMTRLKCFQINRSQTLAAKQRRRFNFHRQVQGPHLRPYQIRLGIQGLQAQGNISIITWGHGKTWCQWCQSWWCWSCSWCWIAMSWWRWVHVHDHVLVGMGTGHDDTRSRHDRWKVFMTTKNYENMQDLEQSMKMSRGPSWKCKHENYQHEHERTWRAGHYETTNFTWKLRIWPWEHVTEEPINLS